MDLNTIQLPAHIITDLYKNVLIDTREPGPVSEKKEARTELKFLGENKKKILILVDYADAVHIPDKQLQFLTNLLTAIKLNLGDVAVFNIHEQNNRNDILSFFKSKTVFLFGVEPNSLGLPVNFPHFQIQPFDKTTYLFSPALHEIEYDKILKSKLWVCLKKIFNL